MFQLRVSSGNNEPCHEKTGFIAVRTIKLQISLRIWVDSVTVLFNKFNFLRHKLSSLASQTG